MLSDCKTPSNSRYAMSIAATNQKLGRLNQYTTFFNIDALAELHLLLSDDIFYSILCVPEICIFIPVTLIHSRKITLQLETRLIASLR